MLTSERSETGGAICPGCGQPISLQDVNVVTDLALCRACGKTWTFSLASATKAFKDVDPNNPPKGVRVETDYEGGTKIIYKSISRAAYFLLLFTAFWGGGSMTGIYGSQIRKGHFSLFDSLMGLPFLAGTIVLCSATAFLFAGRWEIRIRPGGEGSVFVGVGKLGWRRTFACGPGTNVAIEKSSFRVNNQPQDAIVLQQGTQKIISFASVITNQEVKLFIAAAISRALN